MREALEQIHGVAAIEQVIAERTERAQPKSRGPRPEDFDALRGELEAHRDDLPSQPEMQTRTGEEARSIADKPHLTGDPEWDALELAETDPSKEPLQVRY